MSQRSMTYQVEENGSISVLQTQMVILVSSKEWKNPDLVSKYFIGLYKITNRTPKLVTGSKIPCQENPR